MAKKKYPLWQQSYTSFPAWICPYCQRSIVAASKDSIVIKETPSSERSRSHPNFDFDWVDNRFAAFLHCQDKKCGATIVVSGTAGVDQFHVEDPDGYSTEYVDLYKIMSIVPGPPIFVVKDFVPKIVAEHLADVFSLLWISPSASINRLRVCLEDLLTQQKVKRFSVRNGKRNSINLHDRIVAFSNKNKPASDSLLALKWIGNSGSHSEKKMPITREDVVDAMEILEHALDQIYETKGREIAKKIQKINLKKGL